ncbi:MAG: SphA family protein [Candidatus Omnitrophota bacterium]
MDKKYKVIFFAALVLFGAGLQSLSYAGEQGHYYPGIMNIRDVVMPPKGFYYATYNPYLSSDSFVNADGDEVDQITVSGSRVKTIGVGPAQIDVTLTGTLAANVDVDLDVFTTQHVLMWVTDYKILGANYAAFIAPSYGNASLEVALDVTGTGTLTIGQKSQTVTASKQVDVEADKDGFGDLLVQPVWLGWHGEEYDAALAYSFFAPTGAYDSDDFVNVGLGYWTHQAQASFVYYPTILAPKATALMVTGIYGYSTEKDGFDLTPGQTIDLEYGISQYLHPQIEIGVSGYQHWQITDDKGSDASDPPVQDFTSGVSAQVSVWPIVNKFYLSFRYAWDFGAEDRFESETATLNGVWVF